MWIKLIIPIKKLFCFLNSDTANSPGRFLVVFFVKSSVSLNFCLGSGLEQALLLISFDFLFNF